MSNIVNRIKSQMPEYQVGPLQVLQSAAGYYIGSLCTHTAASSTPGLVEPYDRLSGYYSNALEAEQALRTGNYGRL